MGRGQGVKDGQGGFSQILGSGRAGTSRSGPCWKCHGQGSYMYDENHGKPCEVCCPHNQGWWLLSANHAGFSEGHETWCCGQGCGKTLTGAELPCQHQLGWQAITTDEPGYSPYSEWLQCVAGCGARRETDAVHAARLLEQQEFAAAQQAREERQQALVDKERQRAADLTAVLLRRQAAFGNGRCPHCSKNPPNWEPLDDDQGECYDCGELFFKHELLPLS